MALAPAWAPPQPHPHQLLPASSPLFQRTWCGGGRVGGGISLRKGTFQKRGWGGRESGKEEWKIKLKYLYLFYNAPKHERRKSSRLLPANPEAGTLSNAALPGIHQPRLRRRRRRRRSQHQLLSVGWSEQRRGTAAGTRAEDALGSSPDHIVGKQPLPLPAGAVGGGGLGGDQS